MIDLSLSSRRAVLLVIDVQERLAAAMPSKVMTQLERNAVVLIQAARRLGLPVVVSQQYPKGLGPTVPALEEALSEAEVHRFDKLAFSAWAAEGFPAVRRELGPHRDQWIVCGMETHVCVYQTVRDLAGGPWAAGQAVHLVRDAVASRAEHNWRTGLALAERCGAAVTSTETVVFDLLERAGSDDFKALSRLIK